MCFVGSVLISSKSRIWMYFGHFTRHKRGFEIKLRKIRLFEGTICGHCSLLACAYRPPFSCPCRLMFVCRNPQPSEGSTQNHSGDRPAQGTFLRVKPITTRSYIRCWKFQTVFFCFTGLWINAPKKKQKHLIFKESDAVLYHHLAI